LSGFRRIASSVYLARRRIASVRASGPYELNCRLRRPNFTALGRAASAPSASHRCRHGLSATTAGASSMGRFVGTGPYQLTFLSNDQRSGQALRQLTGGQLPQWRHRHGPPQATRRPCMAPLRSGEVDVLLSTRPLRGDQQALPAFARPARGRLHGGWSPALQIKLISPVCLSRTSVPWIIPLLTGRRPGPQRRSRLIASGVSPGPWQAPACGGQFDPAPACRFRSRGTWPSFVRREGPGPPLFRQAGFVMAGAPQPCLSPSAPPIPFQGGTGSSPSPGRGQLCRRDLGGCVDPWRSRAWSSDQPAYRRLGGRGPCLGSCWNWIRAIFPDGRQLS